MVHFLGTHFHVTDRRFQNIWMAFVSATAFLYLNAGKRTCDFCFELIKLNTTSNRLIIDT